MRRLPSKAEILERAREISSERAVIQGLPAITPTEAELKETGAFKEARIQLMTRYKSAEVEQHRYLADMASELDMKLLEKQSWKLFQRKYSGYRWQVRGLSNLLKMTKKPLVPKLSVTKQKQPSKPKPIIPKVSLRKPLDIGSAIRGTPKPKKRRKRHVARTSKTMRKLRKRVKNGQKTFSFPDYVWKVRKI